MDYLRPLSNSAAVEASHYLEVAGLGEDDIRPILDLGSLGAREVAGVGFEPTTSGL